MVLHVGREQDSKRPLPLRADLISSARGPGWMQALLSVLL